MSTEMARLPPNRQSKRRQQETNCSSSSNSARARSNGPVVNTPHSSVPQSTTSSSPSSSHSPLSTDTPALVSPLSETPLSSPAHGENDRDMRRETPRSRVGSNSGHGASRSGRPPLLTLTNSTDETPRSSLSSEERSRRDERRVTSPPACSDGGLSSGEILQQIQNFSQRQEAFNAKIEEHLRLETATTVDREKRTRRLPKAVTVRVYLQYY